MSPMRIGDAERDRAVSTLADNYAAGRLTKDEYDERVNEAWAARFEHDLDPLFADLPTGPPGAVEPVMDGTNTTQGRWRRPRIHPAVLAAPLMWIMPMLAFAFIAAVIIFSAPWLLFILFWFWVITGCGRRRRHGGPWHGRQWHGAYQR